MTKCDFNKVTKQLCWNHTLSWVFSCKFAAYFQNPFFKKHLWMAASGSCRFNLELWQHFTDEITISFLKCYLGKIIQILENNHICNNRIFQYVILTKTILVLLNFNSRTIFFNVCLWYVRNTEDETGISKSSHWINKPS